MTDTYAGLIVDGVVVQVAAASAEWAVEQGWIPQTDTNCTYGRIGIGDTYDAEIDEFTRFPYPPAVD